MGRSGPAGCGPPCALPARARLASDRYTEPMGRPSLRTALAGCGLLAIYVALRWNLVDVPLGRDEGGYAYVGRVILEGGLPYRDVIDHRPPGIFYLNALALEFVPATARGIHLFLHVFNFATLLAVAALAREAIHPSSARSSHAGWAAALAFAVMSTSPAIQGFAAASEMFMMLPQAACLLLALRAVRLGSTGYLLASGAVGALACWIKQPAATSVAFAGVWAAVELARRQDTGARALAGLRALVLFGLGGVAVSLPIAGYFVLQGIFSDFFYWTFQHGLAYSAEVEGLGGRIAQRVWQLARGDAAVTVGAGIGIAWLLALRRREGLLLLGFLLASLLGTLPGNAYTHYFCQLVPPLALAAGAGAALVLERLAAPGVRRAVAALGVAAIVGVPLVAQPEYYLSASPEQIARAAFGNNPFVESPAIAAVLRRESARDDAVLILGSEPQILLHAERRSAIPYIYLYPLMRAYPRHAEFQRAAWDAVQREPPPWIVTTNMPFSLAWDGRAETTLVDRVNTLVARRYTLRAVSIVGPRGGLLEVADPESWQAVRERVERARFKLMVYQRIDDAGHAP